MPKISDYIYLCGQCIANISGEKYPPIEGHKLRGICHKCGEYRPLHHQDDNDAGTG